MRVKCLLMGATVCCVFVLAAGCGNTAGVSLPRKGMEKSCLASRQERLVSLSVRSERVGKVIRSLSVLAGVDVTVDPAVLDPASLERTYVTLEVERMRFFDVMDWLTRQLGAFYYVKDPLTVVITRGDIPRSVLRPATLSVAGLVAGDGSVFLEKVRKVVEYPSPGLHCRLSLTKDGGLLMVYAPPEVVSRLRKIFSMLCAAGDTLPPAVRDGKIEVLLGKKLIADFGLIDLHELVGIIARKTSLNVGYDSKYVAEGRARETLWIKEGYVTVGRLLDVVVEDGGFDRWEVEPGRGVWLYVRGEKPRPVSGRLPWLGTAVACMVLGRVSPDGLEARLEATCPGIRAVVFEGVNKVVLVGAPSALERACEYVKLLRLAQGGGT